MAWLEPLRANLEKNGWALNIKELDPIYTHTATKQQGPTAALSMMAALAITLATAGSMSHMGSLVATNAGLTGASATVVEGLTAATLTSLCVSAGSSVLNNTHNPTKAFQDFLSDKTWVGALKAGATGGATAGLGHAFGVAGDAATIGDRMIKAAVNTVATTGVQTTFGENLQKAFQAGLMTGTATVVQGTLAHKIGDYKPDTATGLGLHGLAGGLSGAILGGRDGIFPGAVSAMVGEGVAEGTRHATFGKFMGALSGAVVDLTKGRDGTKGLAVGTFTATTAVEENCMRHPEEEEAPDTDDEAEESAVGKFRKGYTDAARKLPGAKAVESAGDAIGDMMAEQASWVYAGEEGYVTAKLAWAQSLKGKPLTPTEKNMLAEGFRETYQAAQGAHDMLSGVTVVIPGKCTEWFLRHTGLADKGTARAVGHVVDDALGVTAVGAVLKGTVTGVGKAVSKASNAAQRQAFQKAVRGMDKGSVARFRADILNKGPYSSRTMEGHLQKMYGADKVTSSTLPRVSQPNVRLAGKELNLSMPTGEVVRVPFDSKGFPIFDKYSVYETKLSPEIWQVRDRTSHFKAATSDLRLSVESSSIKTSLFSESQIQAIMRGDPKIPGYTWHHDSNKIQLVPEVIHNHPSMRHVGGFGVGGK